MKAAYIERPGPPESIVVGDLPMPTPTDSQVLVRVGAVAVNPIDTYLRSGTVDMPIPSPYILGCDLAGTVEAVGRDVTQFKPGNRVWGSNQGLFGRQGTFAQFAAVDPQWLYPTPAGIDDRQAAALAMVSLTAHLGTFRAARLQPGETICVHGGTGGVGSSVVQMAAAVGARAIATAGSDAKAALCREWGAERVVNYKTDDLTAALAEFAPRGVHVWFETTREPDFDLILAHLAVGGRIVVMAGRDARPALPLGRFYTRDSSLLGFALFNAPADQQRAAAEQINQWLAKNKLRAPIGRVMPLEETAAAHRLQEQNTLAHAGTLTGKIVLTL
ncbi:MAG TPA: NADPH:quinone reductase [Thermoguttaceae bacterium]|nr:NADPH:quinone reductase [Thermoguttaceae bacterium]